MRNLFLAVILFQPFIEAGCYYDAALLFLHGCPHAAVLYQRIITAIDGLHYSPIIWVTLRPERH